MILPYDANPGRMEFSERTGDIQVDVEPASASRDGDAGRNGFVVELDIKIAGRRFADRGISTAAHGHAGRIRVASGPCRPYCHDAAKHNADCCRA